MDALAETRRHYLPDKLLPPAPLPALVARRNLVGRLDRIVRDRTLTVLTGPAGSGKTALVSEWAPGRDTTWVTLDVQDDDAERFWRLLLDAVGAVPSAACDGDPVCDLAEHCLLTADPVILVLDGFEHITDASILSDLQRLLRRPPANLRLVICTRRAVGALHISRLTLEGRAEVIGADALRFTRDETAELLASCGLVVEQADIDELWSRTQGWPAAVRLASIAVAGSARSHELIEHLTGHESYLADYQTEEMLDGLDEATRTFLHSTSVTDETCDELADALTAGTGSGATLAALQGAGLPIACVDEVHGRYRYHPLFSGMLRARLAREDPILQRDLHRRAAAWYHEHGRAGDAVRHAVAIGDIALAAMLVTAHVVSSLADGVLPELIAPLTGLPEHARHAEPALALACSIAAFMEGDPRRGASLLHPAGSEPDATSGSHLADIGAVARLLHRMTERHDTPREPADVAPLTRGVMGAIVGANALWRGDLVTAEHHLACAATQSEDHARLTAASAALLAVCRLGRGESADARRLADEAVAACAAANREASPEAAIALAVIGTTTLECDPTACRIAFNAAGTIADRGALRSPGECSFVASSRARWLRCSGDPDGALTVLASIDATTLSPSSAAEHERQLALATQAGGRLVEATTAPRPQELSEPLSDAELAILRYLPSRLTNGEIAGERCLSVNTVKTHLKSIYRKLDSCDRTSAVERARELRLMAGRP